MNFIPVKRCNPYLSRRIGDAVGYIPHEFYAEVIDAVFSGTVESWSDLPSNVQDLILDAENNKRIANELNSHVKKATIQRIDDLKNQLEDIKHQLQSEKEIKAIHADNELKASKNRLFELKNTVEVLNAQ